MNELRVWELDLEDYERVLNLSKDLVLTYLNNNGYMSNDDYNKLNKSLMVHMKKLSFVSRFYKKYIKGEKEEYTIFITKMDDSTVEDLVEDEIQMSGDSCFN